MHFLRKGFRSAARRGDMPTYQYLADHSIANARRAKASDALGLGLKYFLC
jgi:hypothetical protein